MAEFTKKRARFAYDKFYNATEIGGEIDHLHHFIPESAQKY